MFTPYRIGFCSVSKVALVQCEQEYVHRCAALQKGLRFKTVHTVLVRSGSHLDQVVVASNLLIGGFVAISAPTEVFRLGLDRFKSLSDTGPSTFNSGAEQSSPTSEIFCNAPFHYPVWCDQMARSKMIMQINE